MESQSDYFTNKNRYEKQSLLPDISVNYFQGTNSTLGQSLYGYQLGLKIPLLFPAKASRIKASQLAREASLFEVKDYRIRLETAYRQLQHELQKDQLALAYYEEEGQALASEIQKTAVLSYKNGEINFFQYIQSLEQVSELRLSYLDHLDRYNQTVIAIKYLTLK